MTVLQTVFIRSSSTHNPSKIICKGVRNMADGITPIQADVTLYQHNTSMHDMTPIQTVSDEWRREAMWRASDMTVLPNSLH